jgi:hypothetical protein
LPPPDFSTISRVDRSPVVKSNSSNIGELDSDAIPKPNAIN